jgi:dipeptidyl aminopeptidase/acylaminoacyl peptidase
MSPTRFVRLVATTAAFSASIALTAGAQSRRPMTFEDLAAVKAVADPQLSPDGRTVLYTVRTTDVAGNRRTATTYAIPLGGGDARAFPDDTSHVVEARWSPDGRRVAYTNAGQLWIANADGSGRRKLTSLNGGASGPVWSPTGDRIAFVSAVYPECSADACNAEKDAAKEASKVKARVTDELMYRHWNAWDEGTRSHLFVVSVDGGEAPRDLTPGARFDVPPAPFGGSEGYAFSPDGREIAYTAKDVGRTDAWSTDVNLSIVPVTGGAATVITRANTGADQNPVYSADGRYLAYVSQRRAGFESDRWRLMMYDRARRTAVEALPRWDRNADAYVFAPDGRAIYVVTGDHGRDKLFRFALGANGVATAAPALVVGESNNLAFSFSRDARTVAWLRDATHRPAEVYSATLDGARATDVRQVTHLNDTLVAQLALNPAEDFWFRGAGGDSVQGFLLKPPQYTAGQKYPVVLLIHGGPQGAWLDNWHSRWNYQMFAATGAGVVIINPRGSTGYGQKFVDDVSKDWAGKVYTDLMNGLNAALKANPWLDSTRMSAAGGSYGGYIVNWIAGHSNRFKALVSHAGLFNLESMYAATEELWFPEWEFGGPFWDPKAMREQYRTKSPHLFAARFKTPTLVIHGELDYRVPYTEGLSMFTALRRQNVPARLLVFPDEGHWIAKPQNQRLWWNEVQGWLTKYLAAKTTT